MPGDPSKSYTTYGPEESKLPVNPKDAPKAAQAAAKEEEDDDDDDDLFGSNDESEDEEAKAKKEANLAAYRKKKEGKTKPAAKSLVTMDVKPWGMLPRFLSGRAPLRDVDLDHPRFLPVREDTNGGNRRRDRHERAGSQHARH